VAINTFVEEDVYQLEMGKPHGKKPTQEKEYMQTACLIKT
jgi:hypothetical protein